MFKGAVSLLDFNHPSFALLGLGQKNVDLCNCGVHNYDYDSLFRNPPSGPSPEGPTCGSLFTVTACATLLFFVGCSWVATSSSGDPSGHVVAMMPGGGSVAQIDLGEVEQRAHAEHAVYLRNKTGREVEISKVETSCSCLVFEDVMRVVARDETIPGRLILDLNSEPHFSGELAIEVIAYETSGAKLFELVVSTVVLKGTDNGADVPASSEPVPMGTTANITPVLCPKGEFDGTTP